MLSGQSWFSRVFRRRSGSDSATASHAQAHHHSPCRETKDNASEYLDDEMDRPLGDRIKQHLGLCEDCRGWMSTLRSTVALLRGLPRHEAPESLRQKIRDIPRH